MRIREYNFKCRSDCGICCYANGDSVIRLSEEDVDRLSSVKKAKRYIRSVNGITGIFMTNRYCPFYKKGGCSIYESRPDQCRSYPFWNSIVGPSDGWAKESGKCPGINPIKPNIVPLEEVKRLNSLDKFNSVSRSL